MKKNREADSFDTGKKGFKLPFFLRRRTRRVQPDKNLAPLLQEREEVNGIKEITKTGIIPFFLFQQGDRVQFKLMGALDVSYDENPDRTLSVEITQAEPDLLTGTVRDDSFLEHQPLHPDYTWALPEGADITFLGAYDHGEDKNILGELHRSRGVLYMWRARDMAVHTGPVHEIILERGKLQMEMFGTRSDRVNPPPSI